MIEPCNHSSFKVNCPYIKCCIYLAHQLNMYFVVLLKLQCCIQIYVAPTPAHTLCSSCITVKITIDVKMSLLLVCRCMSADHVEWVQSIFWSHNHFLNPFLVLNRIKIPFVLKDSLKSWNLFPYTSLCSQHCRLLIGFWMPGFLNSYKIFVKNDFPFSWFVRLQYLADTFPSIITEFKIHHLSEKFSLWLDFGNFQFH